MDPKCTICAGSSRLLLHKDGYTIWQCRECDLFFVHPQPSANFLSEEVYSEKSGYQGNKPTDLSKVLPSAKQRKILDHILREGGKGSFFDIGCSSGEMLHMVKKLGLRVAGVELNPRTAGIALANGLDIKIGTLESTKVSAHTYDYVLMGDLIEHVPDPRGLVFEAGRILKTGGQAIIITPNMECFWARATLLLHRLFRIPWSAATPPHHLYQFSFSNLHRLLTENGYVQKAVWYTGTPTLKYELGSLHLLKRWKNRRTIGNLLFMVFGFSLYSLVFGINRIVELLPLKRFSMGLVYAKK